MEGLVWAMGSDQTIFPPLGLEFWSRYCSNCKQRLQIPPDNTSTQRSTGGEPKCLGSSLLLDPVTESWVRE